MEAHGQPPPQPAPVFCFKILLWALVFFQLRGLALRAFWRSFSLCTGLLPALGSRAPAAGQGTPALGHAARLFRAAAAGPAPARPAALGGALLPFGGAHGALAHGNIQAEPPGLADRRAVRGPGAQGPGGLASCPLAGRCCSRLCPAPRQGLWGSSGSYPALPRQRSAGRRSSRPPRGGGPPFLLGEAEKIWAYFAEFCTARTTTSARQAGGEQPPTGSPTAARPLISAWP